MQQHPDVFIPRCKATRFFIDAYDKGIDWYSSIFGNRTEKAVGEATVGYLHAEHAPALVAKHIPDVRLIASLRDPVGRTYSSFGRLSGRAQPGDKNFGISFEEKIRRTPRLLEQGKYSIHLQRWFEHFPKHNILVLTFDEMKSDPGGFLKSIYRFLEVDDSFDSPLIHQRFNATATLSSRSKLLYTLYRGMLRLGLFKLSRALDSVNQTKRSEINPDTRRRLIQEVFLADIEKLEKMIEKDLSSWKS